MLDARDMAPSVGLARAGGNMRARPREPPRFPSRQDSAVHRTRHLPVAILNALLGAVVLSAALGLIGYLWARPTEKTELAQWFMASTSLVTVIAAAAAAYFAYRAFVLESQRERARLEGEVRAQASLVAGWRCEGWTGVVLATGRAQFERGTEVHGIQDVRYLIRNASSLPITNVLVRARIFLTLPVGGDVIFELPPRHHDLIPPSGEPVQLMTDGRGKSAGSILGYVGEFELPRVELDLEFTDASGLRWRRWADGRLEVVRGAGLARAGR